jgi:hypothetical protein
MKLALIAVVFCFAVSLFAQPNKSPSKSKQSPIQTQPALAQQDNPKSAGESKTANDGSSGWYTSPEWWIALLTALTCGAITYQAREMKRATEAMKESNKAAMLSAQTLVNSERPWLSVKFEGGSAPPKAYDYVQILIVNSGKSAARVISCTFEEDDFLFPRSRRQLPI